MIVVFLDDAAQKKDGWFAQGGLMISDRCLKAMEQEFQAILCKAPYNIPISDDTIDTEVKWSPDPGNWIRKNVLGPKIEDLPF